ncbi:MAG TPA: 6-bladed beta-propeller [Longimicrobiales bacterium]|nr:6-bladed beta-propeller [Longimicrobiales bacterium]
MRVVTRNLLFLMVLAGCGERPQELGMWQGTIDTLPSGAIRVNNAGTGLLGAGEGWRIVEELRIGAAEGNGADVFGEISTIGVSPTGLIHVVNWQTQEIRVFQPDGRFVRSIGRRGSGPGEFHDAFGLEWDEQGNLWVIDAGNARYTVYDSTGALVATHDRRVYGDVHPWLGGFGSDGFLYDLGASTSPGVESRVRYFRVDSAGVIRDSIPPFTGPAPAAGPAVLHAVTPRLDWRFDPRGYIWFGNTGEYRLVQRSLAGDTVRIVERKHSPLPLSHAETARIRDALDGMRSLEGESGPQPDIPAVKPVFERLHFDSQGNLLVQRVGGEGTKGTAFDVFDPEGRYLGRMESDIAFTTFRALPVFRGDTVWGVTADEHGVDYVVRGRIERTSGMTSPR